MNDLHVPPGHFYSPLPDLREVEVALARLDSNQIRIPGIAIDDAHLVEVWHKLMPFMRGAPFPDKKEERFRYHYENDFYSYGDALVYYGFLAVLRPHRVIEIGSGYSSALALDARSLLKLPTKFTFIEPYPDVLRSLLRPGDEQDITLIQKKVQDVPLAVFNSLDPGDILFIDSSHVAKTGSDVCYEMFEILPNLKPGVLVHFHDMFYPFEYPRQWVLVEKRAWNEIYMMRAFLMYNTCFKVHFFNHYFMIKHPALAGSSATSFAKNCGGALWLRREARAKLERPLPFIWNKIRAAVQRTSKR